MDRTYLPALTEITDPNTPPLGSVLLVELNDLLNYPDRKFSFFKQDLHLSIVKHWIITPVNEPSYLATTQFDAPLEILPWFVNKLDFFMKPSTQGGLPPSKMATDKELVGGEQIFLNRTMYAGNARRDGGYMINNLDRKDHLPKLDDFHKILFSDSLLFQGGMLDLWKDLAAKYENGLL